MQTYERDFTIGRKEIEDFHIGVTRKHWRLGLVYFGMAGSLIPVLYFPRVGTSWSPAIRIALMLAAGLAAVALVYVLVTQSVRSKVKRQIAVSGRDSYIQSIRIDGFGVHVTVGEDEAKMKFEEIPLVRETKTAFYLFVTGNQAWILPKDQMADPAADTKQLRETFDTVIDSKRLKLRKD